MDDTKLMPDDLAAAIDEYAIKSFTGLYPSDTAINLVLKAARAHHAALTVMPEDRRDALTDEQIIELAQKHLYVGTGMDKRIIALVRAIEARGVQADILAEIMEIVPATPLQEGMQRDILADIKRLLARRQSPAFDEKVVRDADVIAADSWLRGCENGAKESGRFTDIEEKVFAVLHRGLAELSKGTQGETE